MKLNITKYEIATGGKARFRAAVVSDVHERNVDSVISAVSEISPDIVLIAGDLCEAKTPDKISVKSGSDEAFRLLFSLSQKYPVYYGLGNHEAHLSEEKKARAKGAGAVLLDNEFTKVSVGDSEIFIGALGAWTSEPFIKKYSDTYGYKILLCHEPERYFSDIDGQKFDLVIAGHAHGGQWRFFGRGVYAPGQGIFPRYTKGLYGNLLVSAGVSNHVPVPRINNRGEILSVTFT